MKKHTLNLSEFISKKVWQEQESFLNKKHPDLKKFLETAKKRFEEGSEIDKKEEAWRFTPYQWANRCKGLNPANRKDLKSKEALIKTATSIHPKGYKLIFSNQETLLSESSAKGLSEKGVIFEPIKEVLEKTPEKIYSVLEKLIEAPEFKGLEPIIALHQACLNNGTFLYIPKGITIEEPLIITNHLEGEGGIIFPTTIIIAEENTQANILELHTSSDTLGASLSISCVIGEIHKNAHLHRQVIQNYSKSVAHIGLEAFFSKKDSHLQSTSINLGGHYSRLNSTSFVEGEGAYSNLYALSIGEKEQIFDQRTFQQHRAGSSVSNVLYKNALLDKSQAIFGGMIYVQSKAHQTDAYQTNRNLLLSKNAQSNSLPGLEIKANDVRCSHGATSSGLSAQELFYLRSRGIKDAEAKELMIIGFLEEIIHSIKDENIQCYVKKQVSEKLVEARAETIG